MLGRIGLVPQQETVFEPQTALEFVEAAARLLAVARCPRRGGRAPCDSSSSTRRPRPVKALSKGMRQRVKVAAAIVHDPEVIVLDEPLNGLDPRQRRHYRPRAAARRPSGRCVIVSSHVLDEVERFGSHVLVIAQGRLAAEGDFRAIRDLMDDRPHRLRLEHRRPRRWPPRLLSDGVVAGAARRPVRPGRGGDERRPPLPPGRGRGGPGLDARLDEVVPLDDDLDSVFRYLVGR